MGEVNPNTKYVWQTEPDGLCELFLLKANQFRLFYPYSIKWYSRQIPLKRSAGKTGGPRFNAEAIPCFSGLSPPTRLGAGIKGWGLNLTILSENTH